MEQAPLNPSVCSIHEKQALMLFCVEEQQMLCLKCVSKHAGHTILDFEDVCKQIINPKLQEQKIEAERRLIQLEESLSDINKKEALLKEESLISYKAVVSAKESILSQIEVYTDNTMGAAERMSNSVFKDVEESVSDLNLRGVPNIKREIDSIDQIESLLKGESYLQAVSAYYKQNQGEFVNVEDLVREVSKNLISISESIKEQGSAVIRKLELLSLALNKKEVPLPKTDDLTNPIPPLYFINEKKRIFKFLDLETKQIVCKSFDSQHSRPFIPLFSGLGRVMDKVYLFGGKEPDTRLITNRSYEIVWRKDSDQIAMVPINRMFKARSKHTVVGVDKFECILIIGGSDESQTLNICELYDPAKDSYSSFPFLNIARENASSCVFTAGKETQGEGGV